MEFEKVVWKTLLPHERSDAMEGEHVGVLVQQRISDVCNCFNKRVINNDLSLIRF